MKLEVGSTIYTSFVEAHVRTSMDSLFDEFIFAAPNIWGSDKGIQLGDDCRVLTPDDDQLLDGYIGGIQAAIGEDVIFRGYDKAGDLASCTVSGTGEFKNLSVQDAVTQICSPFDITVSGDGDSVIDVFRYNLNDKAIDVIRELVTRYGLLANSDGDGNIEISTAGDAGQATIQLIEGYNIRRGSVTLEENRFSEVTVLGQNRSGNSSSSTDGTSERYRPNTSIFSGNFKQGQASASSNWIANLAQPAIYTVTVNGLYGESANTLVDIESETLGVSGSLLIKAIVWSMTEKNGHETTFELVNPSVYGGDDLQSDWVD